LAEFSGRVGKLSWSSEWIWRATDAVTLITIAMCIFVISPPAWNAQYDNETGNFKNESKAEFLFGSLCGFSNFMVWPLMMIAVYLYSHDQSTLTWLYLQYPKLFDAGLAVSYPLFLTHWPILLILQKTKVFDKHSGVSVIMIFSVVVLNAIVYDHFVIQPLEENIVLYFNPPVERPPAAVVPRKSAVTNIREALKKEFQSEIEKANDAITDRDKLIHELEQKIFSLEDELEQEKFLRVRKTMASMAAAASTRESSYGGVIRSWDLPTEDDGEPEEYSASSTFQRPTDYDLSH
jgi:hypothetical protein